MSTPVDIDTQINAAIAGRVEVEGELQFAEGLDPMLKYAANAEVRRRDTQASYTKTKQENISLVSENSQLANTWAEEVSKQLTPEQQTELEELKHTDQEAWREKINTYESANASRVKEKHSKIKTKASEETNLQQRTRLLEEHNAANPDYALTDDIIDNDIPPRITKKLAEGKITFEEYLVETQTFLSAGKVIDKGEEAPGGIDLSKVGGDHKPSDAAVDGDIKASYDKEIF